MEKDKTKVFLTGATGVMGGAALKELMAFPEKYEVTVLARDSKKNRKKLSSFIEKGLKVVWGDLLDEQSLRKGIKDADIVLHVGGMVSPSADYFPEKTLRVNIGSMALISRLIKEEEQNNELRVIKMVYIGSVSQYGSKLPPNHWGKVGDRLHATKLDAYAVSKIMAERIMLEAGLKKWVSIRQTGILHPGLLNNANNPVVFHFPINGVLEWISVEDSGRLLERICRNDVPESLWCKFYNAGGGEKFRLTNYEFEKELMKALGCPPPEKVFEPNWFATDNFHGMWFEDSDELNDILQFRSGESFSEAINKLKKSLPVYYRLTPIVPAIVIKKMMKSVASKKELGPLWWIKTGDRERIDISWGGMENYKKIPDWKHLNILKHDKKKGKTFSDKQSGNNSLRETKCDKGHIYKTSEALESGGHGCPHCLFETSGLKEQKFD